MEEGEWGEGGGGARRCESWKHLKEQRKREPRTETRGYKRRGIGDMPHTRREGPRSTSKDLEEDVIWNAVVKKDLAPPLPRPSPPPVVQAASRAVQVTRRRQGLGGLCPAASRVVLQPRRRSPSALARPGRDFCPSPLKNCILFRKCHHLFVLKLLGFVSLLSGNFRGRH